ncbi:MULTISPECIES: xanthine dehydrogenase small subunit [Psychrobacter]|uniref:xanthine dehydrogenase small subunit n=1 Tax=Psychrobacter TaxID=497 RepID=UPI00146A3C4D|nr:MULTISPECIES: xanthine dehydrogenase small subunit [Psychrobacter]
MIQFYLNGKYVEETTINPNTTVLEYLRLHARQTDTKEGCGSGDCGACTVMAERLGDDESAPFFTFNSCITLLSLLDGYHIMTASYLADNPHHHPDRAQLHPAQQAMVECHGSQCGFCTPGFVMSLASVYENHRNNASGDLSYDDIVAAISGNLCRCTGYRPIIDAGLAMTEIGKAQSASQQGIKALGLAIDAMAASNRCQEKNQENSQENNQNANNEPKPKLTQGSKKLFAPISIAELNQILSRYPQATIWAGGTDLGLTITQRLVDHEVIVQLAGIDVLKSWSIDEKEGKKTLNLGAGMSYNAMLPVLQPHFPEFAALFERIASPQIRNMGTLGGNIANASPIGDLPPVLLALDAQIQLRYCDSVNDKNNNDGGVRDETMPLSEFFLDYKKTKLCAGAYVVGVQIPLMRDREHLFIHKISKRYEDDISACLLAVKLGMSEDGDTIETATIGLGGMAAIPLLAKKSQNALKGQPLTLDSFQAAADALFNDVTPMTDVRASREYRLNVTKRLLIKCGKELLAKNQPVSA